MIKTQEENRQAGEQPQKMKERKLITLDKTLSFPKFSRQFFC
jgi:hypothetical protein